MAFENIKDIAKAKVQSPHYYFLDTNVWVYAMNSVHLPNVADKGNKRYTDFFFEIVEFENKPRPRIIMCSLLMSEIINTYMKKYAMADFLFLTYTKKGEKAPHIDYKKDYRSTEHFKTNYKLILNEIKTYHESIEVIDDCFVELKPFQLLKECPTEQDFNDYYYHVLCKKFSKKKANFSFVTNDGDFKITDFEILTSNISLLELNKP
jgi:predicted nucleic acid-binding protein